ncbi:hypothetical protein DIT68_14405 [Brumimicrobium oceani]|uniref:Uncharacterized protein n=1 Tax=Brumimicrobium oceani TaxID=2100725 RepID=A0A2U2X286_9FLAO|nr:hypothetical protein DIT68_14405 [Brumimicrobium oceani]
MSVHFEFNLVDYYSVSQKPRIYQDFPKATARFSAASRGSLVSKQKTPFIIISPNIFESK